MPTMRPRGHTRRLAPLALAAPAALLALLAALPACSDDPTAPEFTPPRPATEAEKEVAALGNDFGLALLRTVGTGAPADASLCISPLSVQIALTMALNGAAGETESAMHATLGYGNLTMAEVNDAFAGLLDLLPALDPEVRLASANSAWPSTRPGAWRSTPRPPRPPISTAPTASTCPASSCPARGGSTTSPPICSRRSTCRTATAC